VRFLIPAALLFAAACTPTAPPPPSDAGVPDAGVDAGPPAVSDYCELTADAYCSFYLRCGRMAVPDEETCRGVFLESCNGRYERVYSALAQVGLLSLNADGIAACRAHLMTVECLQQAQDLDGPCGQMWQGQQPVGSACGLGIESLVCAPQSTCVLGLDFCGTCRATVDDGDGCGDGIACAPTSSCINGQCVARARAGEACPGEVRCVLGTSCINGTCAAPTYVGVGDACDQVRRCPYRTRCNGGFCEETALLMESCNGAGSCTTGYCGTDNTCQPLKDALEACSASGECVSGVCSNGNCMTNPGVCFPAP